jgi:S1-C subfamily serine protease
MTRPDHGTASEAQAQWLHRHDLGVILAALGLIAVGSLAYRSATDPARQRIEVAELSFTVPGGWTSPIPLPPDPPRFGAPPPLDATPPAAAPTPPPGVAPPPPAPSDTAPPTTPEPAPDQPAPEIHDLYTYTYQARLRLEVRIAGRPRYHNLRRVLAFDRAQRYGEMHRSLEQRIFATGERDWLRTRFEYAYVPHPGGSPRTATGIEYAYLGEQRLYVVTLHGDGAELAWLDGIVAPTLRVAGPLPSSSGLPSPPVAPDYPPHLRAVLPATVLVLVADQVQGRLTPVAAGSGTVVASDGSILTNHHVIFDRDRDRLRDAFVIGRPGFRDPAALLVCAGHPDRARLLPDLDLALIKCDSDLDGRPLAPHDWPAARIDMDADAVLGQPIWIVGYPDHEAAFPSATAGEVTGASRAGDEIEWIKTTAAITPGNSGGAVVDQTGRVIGVPTAYRHRTRIERGQVTDAGQIGVIRPIARARALIDLARRGWRPRRGDHQVDEATPATAPALEGADVVISSVVRDAANDQPIADAIVTVFKPGVRGDQVDLARMQEQAFTWGQSNSEGIFTLRTRVPRGHTYTVAVIASGYQPLVEDDVLVVDDTTPEYFDPWGFIHLEK